MKRKTIRERIEQIKREKNAIVLAHNYQIGEVQDVADFVGDSLDLSRRAAETSANVIVFCGVHFMAEMAKILSPEKLVLLPDLSATCPLADMITENDLKRLKSEHPEAVVVSYVNTSAKIKALSDICCTSANGVKVISSIEKDREIIFVPDKWLGDYIAKETERDIILWPGFCPTHQRIIPDVIKREKERHPTACVLLHPECMTEAICLADKVFGTGGMVKYVRESNCDEFIIGTETGIIYRLKKENPKKSFYPATELAVCPNMKLITLEKVLWALEEEINQIEVDRDVARSAKVAIEKMLAI
jgi:quinolinate synthase